MTRLVQWITIGIFAVASITQATRLVYAHELEIARADATFDTEGNLTLVIKTDIGAYVLEQVAGHLAPARMEAFAKLSDAEAFELWTLRRTALLSELVIQTDGRPVTFRVDFPPLKLVRDWAAGAAKEPLEGLITIRAVIPPGTRGVQLTFPPNMGRVQLNVTRPGIESKGELLDAGMPSPVIRYSPTPPSATLPETPHATPPETISDEFATDTWSVTVNYLWLGFEHILPKGLDHILFVLGLFLLAAQLRPLLWQVTAFTCAHTITLALSTCNVISLDPDIVEPLIALSIAFVAIENLFTSKLHVWRPLIVFAFGLLHGLGFAGVLGELGLPQGQFVPALISFNLGVELGQLAVILIALAAVGWWRHRPWYRSRIVIPLSALIACLGLYWTITRIWFPDAPEFLFF